METEDRTRLKASEIYTICQHDIKSTKLKFKKCVTYNNEHNDISKYLTPELKKHLKYLITAWNNNSDYDNIDRLVKIN